MVGVARLEPKELRHLGKPPKWPAHNRDGMITNCMKWLTALIWGAVSVAALCLQPADAQPVTLRQPETSAQVKTEIVRCGLADGQVLVGQEQDSGEEAVWVTTTGFEPSELLLKCVARASLKIDDTVYFKDEVIERRYQRLYETMSELQDVANSRQWLQKRGMLAGMPLPEPSKPLSDYAGRVESSCGIMRGRLLIALNDHLITYVPKALGTHIVTDKQFDCVMNTTTAANLGSFRVVIGFVGKELISKTSK